MQDFFNVTDLAQLMKLKPLFQPVDTETVPLLDAVGRVAALDMRADVDLPNFPRATMDGYAVQAASTFGASESNPAYLVVVGEVVMGGAPNFRIAHGEAARIPTGGMLPEGADAVVMVEYSEPIDETTLEVYRSVAPGQYVVSVGEDFSRCETLVARGCRLRPQEVGLLAAFGHTHPLVYRRPLVGIISTGDEVVPAADRPAQNQIRDINTYTLSALVQNAGGLPLPLGIVQDDPDSLSKACREALDTVDMLMISGGSSVGTRDYTIETVAALPRAEILAHGIAISPGKPTILARAGGKPFWGMPGHVVSAMVVFSRVVCPFLAQIAGQQPPEAPDRRVPAALTRNIASAQGRVDFIRVRLERRNGVLWAEPLLGKSALLNTMVKADGLIQIPRDTEGLDALAKVDVILF